jgi:DUF4097 and DUF4098 domain-containing protein YvlB
MSSFDRREDEQSEPEQIYDVTDECAVTIETSSGDVKVTGWDRRQISLRSEKTAVVEQHGNKVQIRPLRGRLGDIALRVPRSCDITLRMAGGDVELGDLSGRVSLQSMSGDVKVADLQGELEVHTVSGDISCRSCRLSRVSVDSASGDVTIESPLESGGSYHIRKASGDLLLLLPEDQQGTLRTRSVSGDVECQLPHEMRWRDRHEREVLINGGGVEFQVESVSGDIHIEAASSVPEPHPVPHAQAGVPPTPPKAPEPPAPPSEPVGAAFAGSTATPFGLDEPGPAPEDEEDSMEAKRMAILKAIEEKRLSVGEGLKALEDLGE